MALISLNDLHHTYRGPSLLDGVDAQIGPGDRIGLLGRNGAGKSTLMKIISGDVIPDTGTVVRSPGIQVARLTQDVPADLPGTIKAVVLQGQKDELEPDRLWQWEHSVDQTLSRMELDPEAPVASLSSGMKRRVLLAQAIAGQPDVLMLDEPTNHLDIESILWLESFLSRWKNTLIFVTHDRSFLQSLATRIWEVDRGRLFDWTCDYQTFLKRKEAALQAQEKQDALFDKRLAEEEAWIRQGIKARRTRNEGRVRALKAMRVQRSERRSAEGKAKLNFQDAQRSGMLVANVDEISFAYGDHPILHGFSTQLMRGDKVGIIGPNGAGKTTLLNLLLGRLEPTAGSVRLGTNLDVAYFDQLRDTLDPEATVHENVGEGSDRIKLGDSTKHIMGYLQDFLFTPERARTQVKFLSGGERNRALLAKLMTKPANVIVLDEPTNDLDSETLELLEEQLIDFGGTLIMVSHDRTFLNNVVTSTIVFEGNTVREYVGGYDDWQAAVKRREAASSPSKPPAKKPASSTQSATEMKSVGTATAKKLSYNEQRELKALPGKIESLEAAIEQSHAVMADPEFYQSGGERIAEEAGKLQQLESELAEAYQRWEELEG
ncbi:MAG: ATP-binding cassette domain-containing protein [Planctomycetota bacterium]